MNRNFTQWGIICMSLLFSLSAWAQDRVLTGTVTSGDGEPLIGANVSIKGSGTGTITDVDGMYEISVVDGITLEFSYVGYGSKEIKIKGQEELNVTLSDAEVLDEVVVTGLGISRERKSLGYAVQELDGDELAETREVNIVDALRGKVAGVNIINSSGAPGAGTNITIRGLNSIDPNSNNQPLFVIDGIPVSNETIAGNQLPSAGSNSPASSEQTSFSNRIADINPEDIASMSVLKGPSATALYGLRAANGVILITTKKGKAGQSKVSLTSSYGWENLGMRPEYQTEYREGRFGRLRFLSNGDPLRFQSFGPKVYDGQTPLFNPIEDFFQTGRKVSNGVSFSGGSEKLTYHSSFNHLQHEGIIPFSDWERFSARLAGTLKVSEKFSVNAQVNFTNSGGLRPHSGDKSIMSSLSYHPTSFDINDYQNPDGSMKDFSNGIIDNPRYLAEFSQLQDNVNRLVGGMGFDYQITDWLSINYVAGLDQYSDQRSRIVPPGIDLSSQTGGFIIDERINYREFNSNLLVTATKQLSDFNLSFTAGHSLTDIKVNRTNVRGENFVEPSFFDLSNTPAIFASNDFRQNRFYGIIGIAKVDWRNSVYLEVTGRNDFSSTLPEANRSFFYPSTSLAWVFSENVNIPGLSFGKLRASWAQVGKDAPPYAIGEYYRLGSNFPFGDVTGFGNTNVIGDADLRPEITTSIEFGADLRFFNNRLAFDVTYFNQLSEDLILSVPISNTTGFSRYLTNAGSVRNVGWEILASATPYQKGNFSWDVTANWSTYEGRVESIREGIEEVEFFNPFYIVNKIEEGGNIGDLYGRPLERDDAGNVLLNDAGFPFVRTDTISRVGNAIPDWVAGITNTFNYKNWSASVLIEYRKGGDLYDMGMRNAIRNGVHPWTVNRYELATFDGVTADGEMNQQEVEINGETLYRVFGGVNTSSDVILQDASWIRLRRVSVSYSLPQSWLNRISDGKIQGASLAFAGNNLWVNTPFVGFDPETNYLGSGSNVLGFTGLQTPQTRQYDFTLRVTF